MTQKLNRRLRSQSRSQQNHDTAASTMPALRINKPTEEEVGKAEATSSSSNNSANKRPDTPRKTQKGERETTGERGRSLRMGGRARPHL